MSRYHIAVLPGDGIGPEVMAVTLRVLKEATARDGPELVFTEHALGAEHYRRTGEALRAPVCVNLKTYATKVENGRVFIEI